MSHIKVSQLKPAPGYVLVEPASVKTETASGIILPDSSEEKPQNGKVLAVGAAIYIDSKEVNPPVKKGNQVIYKKWGGNDVKIEEVEYQFLKFEDILAVVANK